MLADFELTVAGARAAIARLAKRGNLAVVRNGRSTSYGLTPKLAKVLPYGPLHTQAFGTSRTGWDGRWTTVSFSIDDHAPRHVRDDVRSELVMLHFAALHDGLWVSPAPPSGALRTVLASHPAVSSSIFHGSADDSPGLTSPISAWDLAAMRRMYDEFRTTFGPLRQQLHDTGLNDRDTLVARVRVTYRWFVIATTDPDLPAELLPDDWPRNEAHAIYADLFDRLGHQAADRVRHVLQRRAPGLVPLVTQAPRKSGLGNEQQRGFLE